MNRVTTMASALALCAGAANAGGVERAVTSPGLLFEKGNYVELSFGSATPMVSGTQVAAIPVSPTIIVPPGASSGNMASNYTTFSLGVKAELNDKLDLAVIVDQPIGADLNYAAGTGYIYGGSRAKIESNAVTALLKYQVNDNVSVYGGLKAQQTSGQVALFNGYQMASSKEVDYGYVVGAAYEKPEIALRVALTYSSAITHDFDAAETTSLGVLNTQFETEVPQSIALDFQTGVAKDTLVFGSVRWREWSAFEIAPVAFLGATGSALVDYDDDVFTYTLGVGRRLNENWAIAAQLGYEKSNGGFSGNLGPTDGYTSVGLGATYTRDKMKISMGASYAFIGNANTEAPVTVLTPAGTTLGEFRDNHVFGVGVKVGFNF